MALLKSHNQEDVNSQVKGIGTSTKVESKFFTNDPLASDNNTNDNKPGRSIPSMFARMIFFRTAFQSVVESGKININGNDGIPVYHRLVSNSLDILYLIYTRDTRLTVERWNYSAQMAALTNYDVLKEALKSQRNSFLTKIEKKNGVETETFKTDDIYLFFLEDKLIGGTSPFTFTFSAPDWNGLGAVRSFKQRDDQFREYVYTLYCAYSSNPMMKEFREYIEFCKRTEPIPRLKALGAAMITQQTLASNYAQYECKCQSDPAQTFKVEVCQIPRVPFYATKPDEFSSDFFIDSPFLSTINVINTPLFLHTGYHDEGLLYVGNTPWNSDTMVCQVTSDKNDEIPRDLPDREGDNPHVWLSEVDFLEPFLLELPYKVDDTKFKAISDGDKSYLFPLRPMFFKYFRMSDADNFFHAEIKEGKCIVKLEIPITNALRTKTSKIEIEKEYSLTTKVKCWGKDGESVNLGVFPFYRIPKDSQKFPNLSSQYAVMHNINMQGRVFDTSTLEFYIEGNKNAIDNKGDRVSEGTNASAYYHIKGEFDYIQMCWKKGEKKTCGILIPKFNIEITSGTNEFAYGIDFGTTNTHVAYMIKGENTPVSFNSQQIAMQATFLNTLTEPYSFSCGKENSIFMENEKRHFFPHVNDNSYDFPFRTTTIKQGTIDNDATLFGNVAIGYNYKKEYSIDKKYETELKWKLDTEKPSDEINVQCKLFFEELLWMVKNHWILSESANKKVKPQIMITYPMAMTQSPRDRWIKVYRDVFECDENEARKKVDVMVESLAPCFSKINQQAVAAAGLLNIDIGGGTTDFQYYRRYAPVDHVEILSYYNSVKFAGDDLWGRGFEHTNLAKGGESTNNFTKAAEDVCSNVTIQLDANTKIKFGDIKTDDPKELINILLRDKEDNFSTWLKTNGNNVCRKTMFIHYSAIIYYASIWMRDHEMDCPGLIQFTGLGAKYIDLLFGDDKKLTKYTRKIIEKVGVREIPKKFEVQTTSENPKAATAEGAALYAFNEVDEFDNKKKYHPGIIGCQKRLKGDELSKSKEALMNSFEDFIRVYNSLPEDTDSIYRPQLTQAEIDSFESDAKSSLDELVTEYSPKEGEASKSINDPMFFWLFKGSLYKLK